MSNHKINVLVIEDDPISAKLMTAIFASEGYAVRDVEAAEQAFVAIQHIKPDFIILDLALPGVDGLTLARRLKHDAQTQDIAIIAVTAYSDRWPQQEAIGVGCDAYFVKPLEIRQLREQVTHLTRQGFRANPASLNP